MSLSSLKHFYYLMYAITLMILGTFWYLNYLHLQSSGEPFMIADPNSTAGMVLQYAVILYALAAIPGFLYWFKRRCAKIRLIEDESERLKTYYHAASFRALGIVLAMELGVVAYFLLGCYQPMIWVAAIGAVAFVFCKPSERKTMEELSDHSENY